MRDYQAARQQGQVQQAERSLEVLRRQARHTHSEDFRRWVESL